MQNLIDVSSLRSRVNHFFSRVRTYVRGHKKGTVIVIGGAGIIVVLFGALAASAAGHAQETYTEALAAKQSFEYAQVAVAEQEFARAVKDLGEARDHFSAAQESFRSVRRYRFLPILAKQMKAIDTVLQAGINLSSGLQKLAQLGADINGVIQTTDSNVTFADISADQKRDVLKKMSESAVDIQLSKTDIELAALLIDEIPDSGLLKSVRSAVEPVKQQLPVLETIINQAIPAVQTLPVILGYPTQKNYLFLLENNGELRPSGGFIGTYGILSLDAGEISDFTTHDIYSIDVPSEGVVTEPSPGPISAQTSTQHWYLRDIGWFPDFPTTARKALSKYAEEGGTETFDGVIAMTPTVIEALLKITGPITVSGQTFSNENFIDILQYEVEFGYAKDGISNSDRKNVIGDLSQELMKKLFALPKNRFSELWITAEKELGSKQIQLFVTDPSIEEMVIAQGWGGEMKSTDGDYVMVVDANLAALKTDRKMEREISYRVSEENGDAVGTLDVRYRNTAESITQFLTRYRTFTRVYLPQGSQLLEDSGFLTADKIHNGQPANASISEESFVQTDGSTITFTVISGYIFIEPRDEGVIHVKYRLPEKIQQDVDTGRYSLFVQKQGGTPAHQLDFSFDVHKRIESAEPLDDSPVLGDNSVSYSTDLRKDKKFDIILK